LALGFLGLHSLLGGFPLTLTLGLTLHLECTVVEFGIVGRI
jgi:hypothetical protein